MHPILFYVNDNFFIGTYGLMIAAGLLAGTALMAWLGKRRGLASEPFFDLAFVAVVSGFLGARLLYILLDLPGFFSSPAEYLFSRTGFVFLGGLIAAAGACTMYIRYKKLPLWTMADVVAPALAVAHGFGRIGCHLSGCCFGKVCAVDSGIQVPAVIMRDNTLWGNAFAEHLDEGLVSIADGHSLPIWPVQLMESGALLLFGGLLVLLFLRELRAGLVFGIYLIGYAIIRFTLEFFRGDVARGIYYGMSTSQWLSIAILAVGVVWVGYLLKRGDVDAK